MLLGTLWVKIFCQFLDILCYKLYDFAGPICRSASGLHLWRIVCNCLKNTFYSGKLSIDAWFYKGGK